MKRIAILLGLLGIFPLPVMADLSQELTGVWVGEFKGITTQSVIEANDQIDKAIVESDAQMVIEAAQDGLCIVDYTWESKKKRAVGYDGHKHISQDAMQRLCRYHDQKLTLVGNEGFLFCDYTPVQGKQPAQLHCDYQRSTMKHSAIGFLTFTKKSS